MQNLNENNTENKITDDDDEIRHKYLLPKSKPKIRIGNK